MRQPDVGRRGAFDADRVRVPGRAVHVELQRARGIRRNRVGVRRRREARNRHEQILVVAVRRHRQLFERPRVQLAPDLGTIRLQRDRLRADVDGFADGIDLQSRIDAHGVLMLTATFRRVTGWNPLKLIDTV